MCTSFFRVAETLRDPAGLLLCGESHRNTAAWYALCMVDALLMKQVADTVPMTTWSRTLYNVRSRPDSYLRSLWHRYGG